MPESAIPSPDYKWIALINTTVGMLLVTIDSSILRIALPDIFRGIGIDPLEPQNTNYLLWMILGFLVVTAVLVVSLERLGDVFGRVRTYNLGFAVFTASEHYDLMIDSTRIPVETCLELICAAARAEDQADAGDAARA